LIHLVEHRGPWFFEETPIGCVGEEGFGEQLKGQACWVGRPVASLDLCCVGFNSLLADFFTAGREKQKAAGKWLYVGHYDGDEQPLAMDLYNEPLGLHDPAELLELLRAANVEARERGRTPYRRFVLAEALLAGFLGGAFGDPANLHVLSWGH